MLALLAALGLLLNLSFTTGLVQPDWSLAILLGVLLSDRKTWVWVLPCVVLHDLVLYWSAWVTLPFILFVAVLLTYADVSLAPGQQQRWFGLVFGCFPLLMAGMSMIAWLLTMMLATWVWFLLSRRREKVYVEPA